MPVIPASPVLPDPDAPGAMDEIRRMAGEIGYPLMLKASHGGGGQGAQQHHREAALPSGKR